MMKPKLVVKDTMALKILRIIVISISLILCSCNDEDEGHTRGIPGINPQTIEVQEDVTDSEIIGTVQAEDPNGDALTFSLAADNSKLFRLSSSGEVSLIRGKSLDFETKAEHRFTVRVTDGKGEFFQFVTIAVLDVEQPPTIQDQTFEVTENILDSEIIGTVQAQGLEGDLSFTITSNDNGLFDITSEGQLSLMDGATLDFETNEVHTIIVEVDDGLNEVAKAEITIMVTDIAIVMEDQSFVAEENISDAETIGNIQVEDFMDNLTFTITNNSNDLFEITEDGQLSLKSGEVLDFETENEHTITIAVMDDTNEFSEAEVTIIVMDVSEADPRDVSSFVTTWTTSNANESVGFDQNNVHNTNYGYEFTVNWGDGTIESLTSDMGFEHEYASSGIYTVSIVGDLPYINIMDAYQDRLTSIDQWGTIEWQSMEESFQGAVNLRVLATDIPNLSRVESLRSMFQSCSSLVNLGNEGWNVVNISDFVNLFRSCSSFNGNISSWNVTNATNMAGIFQGATNFNQNIGGWNVENVIEFSGMFFGANSFNQDISGWDVRNANRFYFMFSFADSFNQDLSTWDVANVTDFDGMFNSADSFDQNLGSWGLNINGVSMGAMFSNSGLSLQNYSATITGWADNPNTPEGITLGASGLNYCNSIIEIYSFLTTPVNQNGKGWTIDDNGPVNCQ